MDERTQDDEGGFRVRVEKLKVLGKTFVDSTERGRSKEKLCLVIWVLERWTDTLHCGS